MTIQATEDKLRQLHLSGMAGALRRQRESTSIQQLGFEDRLAMLVDSEYQERETRRLARLVKTARLKYESASVEAIDYHPSRRIDRKQMDSLAQGDWMTKGQNLILRDQQERGNRGSHVLLRVLVGNEQRAGLSWSPMPVDVDTCAGSGRSSCQR